jgi:hypothetical protein
MVTAEALLVPPIRRSVPSAAAGIYFAIVFMVFLGWAFNFLFPFLSSSFFGNRLTGEAYFISVD